jgi:beta-glucosidase/6-phospho-beta-glucosidase/beta-galactosidase
MGAGADTSGAGVQHSDYLNEACKAITQDGVNLTTYYAWSFLDNFEWCVGLW